MDISIIGLGKLGLCTAACFAAAGHKVFGYDLNDHFRTELKVRRNPIDETGLTELLETAWDNLYIVDDYATAVNSSEATLIIVPTPSLPDGSFTNQYLIKALEELAPTLKQKADFHIVDIVSTVMPGSCDKVFTPLLEQATGKIIGKELGLVYNPEFIALGSVIHNFLNPDMVLIGTSDLRSSAAIQELYSSTCRSNPVMSVMSLINAEIAKISLNCYVTMKISYANGLTALCENVPGADVDIITAAIGADTRVGSKYLKGGLGFGGPCFPRDNLAFQAFAEEFGQDAILGKAVVAINSSVPERIFNKITSYCTAPAEVTLLGLSYKACTHIIEESQSIMLAQLLVKAGYKVKLHDPKAIDISKSILGSSAEHFDDVYAATTGSKVIVLLTDWPEYKDIDWSRISKAAATKALIVDSWRVTIESMLSCFEYYHLGIGK